MKEKNPRYLLLQLLYIRFGSNVPKRMCPNQDFCLDLMSGNKGGEEEDRQWNLRSLMLVGMINLSPLSIRLLDIIVWSIWRQMQESIQLPGRQVISLKRIHLDFNPTFSFYSKKTSFSCSFPLIRFLFPSPATPWARDCRFAPLQTQGLMTHSSANYT